MRYLLAMLFFSIFSLQAFSQNFAWAKSFDGAQNVNILTVIPDSNGNIYVGGRFIGTVDFAPGSAGFNISSNGDKDAFVAKLDKTGNLLWVKNLGGNSEDFFIDLSIDHSNNVLITGFFKGTADFDPGNGVYNLTAVSSNEIFIAKLSTAGNFIWAKRFGSYGPDWGMAVDVDINNNVYLAGWFYGTVDFDPGVGTFNLSSHGSYDVFITKMDSNGIFTWAKSFGTYTADQPYGMHINKNHLYVTGTFDNTVDFDAGTGVYNLTSNGSADIFIAKYSLNGNFEWAKSIGGSGFDQARNITSDNSGKIYLTGRFENSVDFDPGNGTHYLSSTGGSDVFICKMDTSGMFHWAKKLGSSLDDFGIFISVDQSKNVYTSGYYSSTMDFDPGTSVYNLTSNGQYDGFISKLDSNGNYITAFQFGANENDVTGAIALDKYNNIYAAGHFENTVDFDPGAGIFNLTNSSNTINAFILKLTQCTNSSSVFSATACGSYTSPSGKYTWATSGVYTDTIQNAAGCDSTMIINLTIKENSQEVLFVNTCGSYTSPSGKYTWTSSGTYNDTIQNSIGCDSVLVIGLIINPNSHSTINHTACLSYNSPSGKHSWKASGTYHDTLQNANGCDSILTINLTVKQVDTSVTVNQNILIANANNATYQWIDCNNGPIAGGTNKSYLVAADGTYAVIVSQNNCSDTSACIPIIISGIGEHQNAEHYKIYPNPSSGSIMIEAEGSVSVEIMGITGKILWRNSNVNERKTLIDLSNLNNGIYFIQIKGNKGFFTKKLVLTK